MKNLLVIAIAFALCASLQAQKTEKFLGTWDFTTETGEAGYESGVMIIAKESVKITFTNVDYKYPSDWVKYESDSLKFETDVDGALVEFYLVVKDASILTGFAEWGGGETVLNLTRKKAKE